MTWRYIRLIKQRHTTYLERAAAGIGLHVNANKTEYMCYNQTGNIATLDGASLKLVDKFTYLGSSVSSTEKDIDTRLWTAIDRLSIIWKSDLTDKIVSSRQRLVDCYMDATWTLESEITQECWEQYCPGDNTPRKIRTLITKTIQVRYTAGEARTRWLLLFMDVQVWDDQHELTYNSYVRTRVVILRTCRTWRETVRDIRADGATWWWWWSETI